MVSVSGFKQHMADSDSLLVHCAGAAQGMGTAFTRSLAPLERLQYAVRRRGEIEISCSIVSPGDVWNPGAKRMNYYGPIGLVVAPLDDGSVGAAIASGYGTQMDASNPDRRTYPEAVRAQSIDCVYRAMAERPSDGCNEITLYRYEVLGVFLQEWMRLFDHRIGKEIEVTQQMVRDAFAGLPIFYIHFGRLYACAWNEANQRYDIQHHVHSRDIYTAPVASTSALSRGDIGTAPEASA